MKGEIKMKKESLVFILRAVEVIVLVAIAIGIMHISNMYIIVALSLAAGMGAGVIDEIIVNKIENK